MSNDWRDDTLSMVQLIQRGMSDGPKYYEMVKADEAQGHPIIEINGQLHWEKIPLMATIENYNLLDEDSLNFITIECSDNPDIRELARNLGWSLDEYQKRFHPTEEQKND